VHSPDQEPAPWETHSYPNWSPGAGTNWSPFLGRRFFDTKTDRLPRQARGQAQETCCKREAISAGRGEDKTMQVYANMLDMLDSGLANVSTALTSAVRKTPFFENNALF
jgi:hypothetical protein